MSYTLKFRSCDTNIHHSFTHSIKSKIWSIFLKFECKINRINQQFNLYNLEIERNSILWISRGFDWRNVKNKYCIAFTWHVEKYWTYLVTSAHTIQSVKLFQFHQIVTIVKLPNWFFQQTFIVDQSYFWENKIILKFTHLFLNISIAECHFDGVFFFPLR